MLVQWVLIAAFFTGFLRNLIRTITPKKTLMHRAATYLFGIFYGILFTYLIATSNPLTASLWFGLIIALIVSNKMNGIAHILGLATIIAVLGINGLQKLNWLFLVVFALIAVADEIIGNKKKHQWTFRNIALQFIGLQIVGLLVSIFTGVWMVFFSIVVYDIGFIGVELIIRADEPTALDKPKRKKKKK